MPDAVQIAPGSERAIMHLKSWSTEPGFPSLVPPGLGGDLRVLNLRPSEWIVVSEVLPKEKLRERLDRHLKNESIVAVEMSSALQVLRVEGPLAYELLARGAARPRPAPRALPRRPLHPDPLRPAPGHRSLHRPEAPLRPLRRPQLFRLPSVLAQRCRLGVSGATRASTQTRLSVLFDYKAGTD